jgi:hypothetical protein
VALRKSNVMSYGTEVVCMTHRGTLLKWYTIHSTTLLGRKTPKCKAGHLSNLGGYATINTKRTKVRKHRKKRRKT